MWPRAHLSAISALSPAGTLYCHAQEGAIHSAAGVACLAHLRREVFGRLVLIGDGAPLHRRQVVRACLAHGLTPRPPLDRRPADAPELNPGEGLWPPRQGVEWRQVCCVNSPLCGTNGATRASGSVEDHVCSTAAVEERNCRSV